MSTDESVNAGTLLSLNDAVSRPWASHAPTYNMRVRGDVPAGTLRWKPLPTPVTDTPVVVRSAENTISPSAQLYSISPSPKFIGVLGPMIVKPVRIGLTTPLETTGKVSDVPQCCQSLASVDVNVTDVTVGANWPDNTGGVPTVNGTPALLNKLLAVTTTLPVVAPGGTVAGMLLSLLGPNTALTPLNVTPPKPGDSPNPFPMIVTGVPTGPEFGVTLKMLGTT